MIDTNTEFTEDTIYFKNEGDYISIAIEGSNDNEATDIIYKDSAKKLSDWLINNL